MTHFLKDTLWGHTNGRLFTKLSISFQNRYETRGPLLEIDDEFQESDRIVLRRGISLLLARLRGLVRLFALTRRNKVTAVVYSLIYLRVLYGSR